MVVIEVLGHGAFERIQQEVSTIVEMIGHARAHEQGNIVIIPVLSKKLQEEVFFRTYRSDC